MVPSTEARYPGVLPNQKLMLGTDHLGKHPLWESLQLHLTTTATVDIDWLSSHPTSTSSEQWVRTNLLFDVVGWAVGKRNVDAHEHVCSIPRWYLLVGM